MVYYKLILNDKRSKADQIYPVVIRVTSNRVSTTVSTGIRVHLNEWDNVKGLIKSANPNWQVMNHQLLDFYNKVQRAIIRLQDENDFSFENLKIKLTEPKSPIKSQQNTSFNEFVEQTIKELHESNKSGNALVYQASWNRLLSFIGNRKLSFIEVDYTLLEAFKGHLLKDNVKTNTISNYFRTIRAIYNRGIKAKHIDRCHYPFHDIAIKSEKTLKRAVNIQDIGKLSTLALKRETSAWHSRNYCMLSFSLIGISFTDLAYLKPSDIQKGRLIYRRRKTHKLYNIKLTDIAKSLLDIYKGRNTKYLLPVLPPSIIEDSLEAHKVIKQFIKTTNKYLKNMSKELDLDKITTYVTRHTWATTAKRMGYSNELIAEALGHEYGNKITNIYLDSFDQSVIDELNEKVLKSLE